MIPSNKTAIHPGTILLKEFLEPMKLTQKALAHNRVKEKSMLSRIILSLAMVFSLSSLATAASVEINWNNPDSYSDIRHASSETRKSFSKRVFAQLEEHITKLAKALPEDQKLVMNFSNVALAGYIDRVRATDTVRVVEGNKYPARLAFNYTLRDASGNVLKQDDENLISSAGTVRPSKNEPFGIEKKMLTDWFNKTLK